MTESRLRRDLKTAAPHGLSGAPLVGRIGRSVAGAILVLLGVALVPLPGPGLLVILGGLFVLAKDYAWAARLLEKGRRHLERTRGALGRKVRPSPPAVPPSQNTQGDET